MSFQFSVFSFQSFAIPASCEKRGLSHLSLGIPLKTEN